MCDSLSIKIATLGRHEGEKRLSGDPHKLGHEIEKYLSLFRKYLGKHDKKYLDLNFGFDWCCAYVYYVVLNAGFYIKINPTGGKSTLALVGIWYQWALQHSKFLPFPSIPKAVDIVIYDKLVSNFEQDHIGIVLEDYRNYILTAEGNINNATGIFKRMKTKTLIKGFIRLEDQFNTVL